jgi:hypothetical protein
MLVGVSGRQGDADRIPNRRQITNPAEIAVLDAFLAEGLERCLKQQVSNKLFMKRCATVRTSKVSSQS